MNAAQRKFLIEKIEKESKILVDAIKAEMPEYPNVHNYLFHATLSGKLELVPNEQIKEVLRKRALEATGKEWNWLCEKDHSWGDLSKRQKVEFKLWDILVMPPEFKETLEEYHRKKKEIEDRVAEIIIKTDGLVTRITLASDKTLEKVISEIDNMGDISLFDTKLRLAGGNDPMLRAAEQKQIQ